MTSWIESHFGLAGKTALITGSSKGIGASIALAMANAGADVILQGRSSDSLAATKSQVEAITQRPVREVLCDVSSQAAIEDAFAAISTFNLDILVNNAGSISRAPAAETAYDDWSRIMEINLNSIFQISQLCGREMLARGTGRIINIASLLSFQGGINVPAYTASKHGVAGLTKALANEWGARGVNVNAIAPGYISTDNTAALRSDSERNSSILSRIPMNRWGNPEDIAGAAVFLASEAAHYINGEILTVDGGWMGR